MATIPQIRGMLLEEAVLYLLRSSGYRTIDETRDDPTLRRGHAGLEVIGRGSVHQIDAIADFVVAHPFSHPQRLLVEAKFKKGRVGIEVLRNAVGVLKDVGEYWVTSNRNPAHAPRVNGADGGIKNRYHYQYAIFSAAGYAPQAEDYAFAHDVYLIPLGRSRFMEPIITSIGQVNAESFGARRRGNGAQVSMTNLRAAVRNALRNEEFVALQQLDFSMEAILRLRDFAVKTREINQAVLGMIANQLPVFLVRGETVDVGNLRTEYEVRIYWDRQGWYLRDAFNDELLFSFDLPETLFNRYANEGILTATRALDLKVEYLREIQAIITTPQSTRVVTFHLDQNWIERIREGMRRRI